MIKVVFFGTPEFSKHFLSALNEDEEIFVSAIVAQPDQEIGRKKILTAPPTKEYALKNDIPVLQPTKLRDPDFQSHLRSFDADVFVVVAYGRIIPIDVLEIPKKGTVNVHPSALPKYRGPSPMQAAIANEEQETAVSIMLIDEQMDHGPILAQIPVSISANEDYASLMEKVVHIGTPALIDSVKKYLNNEIAPNEQDHDTASFCRLLKKEDGLVDWNEPAKKIDAQNRAYRPWPGIYTCWDDKILKLTSVTLFNEELDLDPGRVIVKDKRLIIGTGTTPLEILELQLEGKSIMNAKAFLNGYPKFIGTQV